MYGKPRLQQLGEIVVRSEAIRWKRRSGRVVTQAALAAGALVLGLMFILALHALIWNILSWYLGDVGAALALIVLDIVAAFGLGMLAIRGLKDPLKEEARQVRITATAGMQDEIHTFGGMVRPRKPAAAGPVARPALIIGRRRR